MTRLDVTALYTEINRLTALVSEQAREIERLREALEDTADRVLPDGTRCWCPNDHAYRSHESWCRAARAALAARGGESATT